MTAHKRRCLTPLLVLQLDGPRRESRRRPRPNIADHLAPARPAAARPEEATAQRALAHAALCLHRPLLVGLERDLDACAVGVLDKLGERRDALLVASALLNLSLSEKMMKNALSRQRACVYR